MTIQARATANSIFGLGIYLGGAFASLGAFVDEQELGKTTQGTRVTKGESLVTSLGSCLGHHIRRCSCVKAHRTSHMKRFG